MSDFLNSLNNQSYFSENQSSSNKSKFIIFGLVLVSIFAFSLAAYSYINYSELIQQSKNDNVKGINVASMSKEEKAKVVRENFGKIFNINESDPTIATVTDVEKLKKANPEFYKDAKEGDNLIIITEKKLAVLYRLEENKIINISYVDLSNQSK